MDIFLQQIVNGLTLGCVYAVVALGYTMVYGIIQLINFAHGEVVMIGCMVAFSVIVALAPTGAPALVIVGAGIAAAVPVCMVVGYVVERAAYKPLRNAPRLARSSRRSASRSSAAPGPCVEPQHHRVPQIVELRLYHLGSGEHAAAISNIQIAIVVASVAMMAGLIALVYRTRIGIAMRATSQNPHIAGLMGVDINKVISFTFVVGAALGAVAGVMVGSYYGIAHYQMGFLLGLKAFSAAVLGGIGNIAGAVLGGILMGLIESLGAGYVGDFTNVCLLDGFLPGFRDVCEASPTSSLFGSNYKDVYAFIVLILVLVFRPQGLLGERVGDRA